MKNLRRHRKLGAVIALVATLALTGAAMAASVPSTPDSSHASSTAAAHAANADSPAAAATDNQVQDQGDALANDAHGDTVSAAAQSDLTGGAQDNHGGYVSCVARWGSDCATANQTIPSHSGASAHRQAGTHRP